ncbi:hypothetical protein [Streptomyces avidinii]
MIANLARFHREHEQFYSQAPLRQADELQSRSRALKSLAGRWSVTDVGESAGNPFAGAEGSYAPGLVAESGILFMEGEDEPVELQRLKRDVRELAEDSDQTGIWLAHAMEQAWEAKGPLAAYPALADLLGERHRIIANDWQSAGLLALVARLLRRSLDLLDRVAFFAALRSDLRSERNAPAYLYSASELLDRAADLLAESATLVRDNERRWRVFGTRIHRLRSGRGGFLMGMPPRGKPGEDRGVLAYLPRRIGCRSVHRAARGWPDDVPAGTRPTIRLATIGWRRVADPLRGLAEYDPARPPLPCPWGGHGCHLRCADHGPREAGGHGEISTSRGFRMVVRPG